jgi:hypothetical protein
MPLDHMSVNQMFVNETSVDQKIVDQMFVDQKVRNQLKCHTYQMSLVFSVTNAINVFKISITFYTIS